MTLPPEKQLFVDQIYNALSKLESQVCRNPDLPLVYKDIVRDGFDAIRNIEHLLELAIPAAQPAPDKLAQRIYNEVPFTISEKEWIKRVSEILAAQPAPGWISVEERLPEEGQLVLMWFVTVNQRNSGPTMGSRTTHEEGRYWDIAGIYRNFSAISHWQPISAPPGPAQEPKKEKDK